MHRIWIESILADATYELIIPGSNSTIADDILSAQPRSTVFYDETLAFYLALRVGPSSAKLEPSQLEELAAKYVQIHVMATLSEVAADAASKISVNTSTSKSSLNATAALGEAASLSATLNTPPIATSQRNRLSGTVTRPKRSSSMMSMYSQRSTAMTDGDVLDNRSSATSNSYLHNLGHPQQKFQNTSKSSAQELLFSYTYSTQKSCKSPIICASGTCILFPLAVKLDIGRTKLTRSKTNKVNLSATISQVITKYDEEVALGGPICNPEDFDGVNIFENLDSDVLFDQPPTFILSNHHKRLTQPTLPAFSHTSITTLTVIPTLSVSINTTSSGSKNTMLLTILIEKNPEFRGKFSTEVESVQVQMVNALIHPVSHSSMLPIQIQESDQLLLLYNVVLIDQNLNVPHTHIANSANHSQAGSFSSSTSPTFPQTYDRTFRSQIIDRMRLISILIHSRPHVSGSCDQQLASTWYVKLRVGSQGELPFYIGAPAFHGRQFEFGQAVRGIQLDPLTSKSGLEFSFHVMSTIVLRRVFRVQVLIVNHSDKEHNLSLLIPMPSQFSELTKGPSRDLFPRLHWDNDDLVEKYISQQHEEVSIACLENRIDLNPIPPNACHLANLHYIVIKGQVHKLPPIEVLDTDSGTRTTIKEALQVFVERMHYDHTHVK
ncbi:hypothetical protein BATDEDRAFT_89243 [Batrachochytrium dendrobatidis JAM81]|uniref:Trafficking protein particle complex II-specific subunit 65 IgD3 domain-containing protein n=1 Tax=Batrachochytrium dendrobatidis (strain JAM81 / FGSC 10211) TaxID=684364 RepID=F4P570_BATDJ|nr:uncharacterized protein BATDEDRAFT_89243 [Batrachochytrium dendrobatidis JAM81]EGF80045.1 hypothetical protein BATDEDRAFT_89243 [Batrachochytrium dendrobatidis JAM81]|eukprot:XP_006679763.1 hypothetical protein BATDEDRAFT_89243 [Batrachochytrium dendrobatidis JAM81]